jgi:hypothetical protein
VQKFSIDNSSSQSQAKHTHGTNRPCVLRAGINEGIYVLNNQTQVQAIFTTNLLTCTQVILWNATATFTCHIHGEAPNPLAFVVTAYQTFTEKYGKPTKFYLISGTSPSQGNVLRSDLQRQHSLNPDKHVTGVDGYAINISTGAMGKAPDNWDPSKAYVAGWLTAPDLIDHRIVDPKNLGSPFPGDYHEPCPICRHLEL